MIAANTQPYQAFKLLLAEYVPVDRDLLHVVLGAVLVMIAVFAIRQRRLALLAGFAAALMAGIGMEVMDLRESWVAGEALRWELSVSDLLRTLAVPAIALVGYICFAATTGKRRS
ncbi:MAG: hypothetical protein AAFR73_10335 [Pseudomonadota bacterium]